MTIGRLLGIKSADEQFIEELMEDLDELNIKYPTDEIINIISRTFHETNEEPNIPQIIIECLMNRIQERFFDFLYENIENKFYIYHEFNYLDSHYLIDCDDKDLILIDDVIEEYIYGDKEKSLKLLEDNLGIELKRKNNV